MPDVSYYTAVGICNQCIQNGKSVIKVTSELDKARHLASELSSGDDSLEIDIFDTRRGEVLLKSENIKPKVKKQSFPSGSCRDSTNKQTSKEGDVKKYGKKWWWSLKWKQ